jgi:hypothetical protein
MAITVKHKFVSAIPDDTDTTIVRPSNWNDDHDLTGTVPVANGGTGAATLTGYVIGNGTSAMTASTTIPSGDVSGLGTMATQNANAIAVTGGTINGTTIGATTASTGAFTYASTNNSTSTTPALSYNASNSAFVNGATVSGSYLQNVMQNKSGTAGASTNFAVSNDLGTDSTYYGEFGMNSSVYSASTPADFFSLNNGIYFSGHDGDMTVGSGNGYKTYLAWGTVGQSAHVINASGALGLNTNITGTTNFGTSGQLMQSAGSAATPTWSSALSGLTINNSVIGGTTPAAGTFTTLGSTGTATLASGSTTYVTITGDASYPMIQATGGTNTPLVLSPLGTGALQAQKTDSTATGGNVRGANAVDWQTSRSAATQVASGYYNIIGGGYANTGTASTSVTTQSGTMNATTAVTLSGSNASIKVGQYITGTSIAAQTYVAAISGTALTLSQAASGSSTSTLSFYTPHGIVVGGGNNQATGAYSFIGGGGDAGTAANRNTASGAWSTVAGGWGNQATGDGATIAGGGNNNSVVSGNIAGGAYAFIGGGTGNNAGGIGAAIIGGRLNSASGQFSTAIGYQALTRSINGQTSFSGAVISTGGDSQASILVLARQTTDATPTVLASNSSAASSVNQVILPNNSAYYFKGSVISTAQFALATTATAGAAGTATITFAAQTVAPFVVGQTIVVAGVTPLGFNGTQTVTACTTTTVQYTNATTGAQTVAGTITATSLTKGWSIEGAIMRTSAVGGTRLIGSPTVTSSFGDTGTSAWSIALAADTTNGGLKVTFTGAAATTIRTVAQIQTTEVTY